MDAALSADVTSRLTPSQRQAQAALDLVIVDYGLANLTSVANALARLGCAAEISDDPARLVDAEAILLPGVGSFGEAIGALRARRLDAPLTEAVIEGGTPFLGICLGLQLLARRSAELGEHEGLGWIDADVDYVPADAGRVPHVGWTSIDFDDDDPLFHGIDRDAAFYFDHSLHMAPRERVRTATVDYGGTLVAAFTRDNVMATQFHPEKSDRNGLRLLRNFLNICLDARH